MKITDALVVKLVDTKDLKPQGYSKIRVSDSLR